MMAVPMNVWPGETDGWYVDKNGIWNGEVNDSN